MADTRGDHDLVVATQRKRLMLEEVAVAITLGRRVIEPNTVFDGLVKYNTYVFFQPL